MKVVKSPFERVAETGGLCHMQAHRQYLQRSLAAKNLIVDYPDAITQRDTEHTSDSNNWLNVFFLLAVVFASTVDIVCASLVQRVSQQQKKSAHQVLLLLLSLNITQYSNGSICVLAFVTYFLVFSAFSFSISLIFAIK